MFTTIWVAPIKNVSRIDSSSTGLVTALSAALDHVSGDVTVILDGDLQDPPESIPALVAKFQDGYDVVYGVRVKREMPIVWEMLYKGFYRAFQRLAYIRVPTDAGDFSLIDRKVVQVLRETIGAGTAAGGGSVAPRRSRAPDRQSCPPTSGVTSP